MTVFYDMLDAAIEARIEKSPCTFTQIENDIKVREWAQKCSEISFRKSAFRFVDRRLQALRKRGRINYSRKTGWHKP